MISTDRQLLRRLMVKAFPWIQGVVAVAGSAGKGLAIRAASGLLHLAGGPGDPAVVRVGDLGTAGTITASANVVTITGADGSVLTLTFALAGGAITVTALPTLPVFELKTKNLFGSEKVTCA